MRLTLIVLVAALGQAPSVEAQKPTVADKVREVDAVAARGPFAPAWSSLEKFQTPDWYRDAKFGIFVHWGLYSVPAFDNEWYPRNMYQKGEKAFEHHVKTFGPQSRFGYKDFIPLFKAEKFDAAAWAALFKAAGAKYVVPVAEHHDGFPMYASDFTEWSAARMGPRRDVVGELATAVRAEGLTFGVSSHRVEHWWFFDQGKTFDSDVGDPKYAAFYGPAVDQKTSEAGTTPPSQAFLDDWLARTAEVVDKYQPQLIWFDWWIAQPAVHSHLQRFAAFYYNRGAAWGKGVAINYKKHGGESFPDTAGVLDIERGQLAAIRPLFWQTDTSVSKTSWGYVSNHDYKTVDSIVDDLIDIVSKNGCLLLNIGPRPDGTIPEVGAADAARDRTVAGHQRRGDLRHPPLDDFRGGADGGHRGAVCRHQAESVHRRGHPVHTEGRRALRHRARVARIRRIDHRLDGTRLAVATCRGRHGRVARRRQALVNHA